MNNTLDLRQAEQLLIHNRTAEARNLSQRLCKQSPDDHKCWLLLGLVLMHEHDFYNAEAALIHACRLRPIDTSILKTLAQSQQAQGKLEAAITTLQKSLEIDPAQADAWFMLGIIQGLLNLHDQAISSHQQAIKIQPDHFGALGYLGNTFFMLGHMEKAIAIYQQASTIQPDNSTLYCNLGMALSSLARHTEAISCYKKALSLSPRSAEIYLAMANALAATGAYEDALDSYRKATALNPDCMDAVAGEAGVLEKLGQYDDAYHLICPLLNNSGPVRTSVAIAFSAICKHYGKEREARKLVDNALENSSLSAMQKLELHFAAGSLLDTLGEYDAAFAQIERGNKLAARQYNPAKDRQLFENIIASFSKDYLQHAPRCRHHTETPVFIVGMPRSGTSLVEQILSNHPMVFGAGELREIQQIASNVYNEYPTSQSASIFLPSLPQDTVDTLSKTHLSFLSNLSPNAIRIVDKMPHNFLHVGLISLLFPNAHIIHCTRNPLDTCLSIYFQYFGGSNDYAYNLEAIGKHYCNYRRLMKHWMALSIPMLNVSYEALVSNQPAVSRDIIEYCGLEWDEQCLHFHKSARITRTASYSQVKKPMYSTSVGKWKHYEQHLNPLIKILQNEKLI